jgi:hypothetical protein
VNGDEEAENARKARRSLQGSCIPPPRPALPLPSLSANSSPPQLHGTTLSHASDKTCCAELSISDFPTPNPVTSHLQSSSPHARSIAVEARDLSRFFRARRSRYINRPAPPTIQLPKSYLGYSAFAVQVLDILSPMLRSSADIEAHVYIAPHSLSSSSISPILPSFDAFSRVHST